MTEREIKENQLSVLKSIREQRKLILKNKEELSNLYDLLAEYKYPMYRIERTDTNSKTFYSENLDGQILDLIFELEEV